MLIYLNNTQYDVPQEVARELDRLNKARDYWEGEYIRLRDEKARKVGRGKEDKVFWYDRE